jgi:hypothetical protein
VSSRLPGGVAARTDAASYIVTLERRQCHWPSAKIIVWCFTGLPEYTNTHAPGQWDKGTGMQ